MLSSGSTSRDASGEAGRDAVLCRAKKVMLVRDLPSAPAKSRRI